MAQTYTFENDLTTTVAFSTVTVGSTFIYGNAACLKLDNNNPNYGVHGTGVTGKLNASDQVYLPESVLIKVE